MSVPANSGSDQVKLVLAWGEGFVKKDMGIITKSLHKDFRYTPYPQSLGLPEQTREQWIAQFTQIISLWTKVDVSFTSGYSNPSVVVKSLAQSTTHSIIEAPGTVIVHVSIQTFRSTPNPLNAMPTS